MMNRCILILFLLRSSSSNAPLLNSYSILGELDLADFAFLNAPQCVISRLQHRQSVQCAYNVLYCINMQTSVYYIESKVYCRKPFNQLSIQEILTVRQYETSLCV